MHLPLRPRPLFGAAAVALLLTGCSSGGQEAASSGTAQALAGTGPLTPSEVLGATACGAVQTAAYSGAPAYAAYSFAGNAGEAVSITITGSTTDEVEGWILRSDFSELTSAGAKSETALKATLPKTQTYYVAFRNKKAGPESFTVSLSCAAAMIDAGGSDAAEGADADAGAIDTGTTPVASDDAGSDPACVPYGQSGEAHACCPGLSWDGDLRMTCNVAPGGSCAGGHVCSNGLVCDVAAGSVCDTSSPPACLAAGGRCVELLDGSVYEPDCCAGLTCNGGYCMSLIGAPCAGIGSCAPLGNADAIVDCENGVCVGGNGALCSSPSQCLSGLCSLASPYSECTCQPYGQSCTGDANCCNGDCLGGTCACVDDGDCTFGSYCVNGVCGDTPGPPSPVTCTGGYTVEYSFNQSTGAGFLECTSENPCTGGCSCPAGTEADGPPAPTFPSEPPASYTCVVP